VLQDLVSRGVHRVLLFVTDDFRGLGEVIGKLFACAQHRLCLLHLQRNLERGLLWEAMKLAREALFRLRRSRDRAEGGHWLGELAAAVAREKPSLARHIEAKAEGYLAFLDYPEEVRVHIYSTNPVESINAGIDLMRLELGGYFPSLPCLEVNLFIQVVNLQHQWWRTPIPTIRGASASSASSLPSVTSLPKRRCSRYTGFEGSLAFVISYPEGWPPFLLSSTPYLCPSPCPICMGRAHPAASRPARLDTSATLPVRLAPYRHGDG